MGEEKGEVGDVNRSKGHIRRAKLSCYCLRYFGNIVKYLGHWELRLQLVIIIGMLL